MLKKQGVLLITILLHLEIFEYCFQSMIKSKTTGFILILVLLIAGWFSVNYTFPRYNFQYIALSVLIIGDLYLWTAVRKSVFHYGYFWKIVITVLFWLPMIMLLLMIFGALIIPSTHWNPVVITYLTGFVLVFYAAKIFPLLFLTVSDLLRVLKKSFHLFNKNKREEIGKVDEGITRGKFLKYMAYISGGLVFGTMLTGMFKWVYQFNLVKQKIASKRLPQSFDGMKIVQISDMHLGSWRSKEPLEEAVRIINGLNADLVLFTGDLVNFTTKEAFRFEETLKKVKAKHGVYAILGNHDYGEYVSWPTHEAKKKNMQQLYAFYRRIGWKLMNNTHELIYRGKEKIALIGVENWGSHKKFPKYGDIKKAVKGIETGVFKILMTHDPTHWDEIIVPEKYDIDISLSGHTHGFQFGIETKTLKWSPAQYVYKHWAGLYKDQNSGNLLYVNRGIGSIGYPGRIGILPEITVLELFKES